MPSACLWGESSLRLHTLLLGFVPVLMEIRVSSLRFSLNPHIVGIETPPIAQAQAWKARYDGRAGPLIDLSQAVPGTPPPPQLEQALAQAVPESWRYGPILGDTAFRAAYAADMSRVYAAPISADHVAITAGCNQAFVAAMLVLAAPGDAVVLPAPWYFNHKMSLDMLGIEALMLPCRAENGFVPTLADAQALLTPNTRAIVLVSPNNPTGAIYPPAVIEAFYAVCAERGIALVLDETYRDFLPGDTPAHSLFARPDWGQTLLSLYSFSKAYALPGFRLGALAAHPDLLTQITKVQDNVQICPPRLPQVALCEQMAPLVGYRAAQSALLGARKQRFEAALAGCNGWRILSAGAYFAFVAHPEPHMPAFRMAEALALQAGIAVLPGSAFGPDLEPYLRFAFANVEDRVLDLLPARLAAFALSSVNGKN